MCVYTYWVTNPMSNLHLYMPEALMQEWRDYFTNRGAASQWVQEEFKKLVNKQLDLKTLKLKALEIKKLIEKSESELKEVENEIKLFTEVEKQRLKDQQAEEKALENINMNQLYQMTKGIMQTYEIKDQAKARKLAIAYLSNNDHPMLTLQEFMKKHYKETKK